MGNEKEHILTRPTLLLKVKNQYDNASWEDFTKYYGNYILAVIKGMGIPYNDVEDLQQTILLRLWKNLPDFDYDPEKGSFRSWLCSFVRFAVWNYLRDRKMTSQFESEEAVNSEVDSLAEREWMLHIAGMAWDNIKDSFSESVQDIYLELSEGRSPDKIAEESGVSRGSVYVYKERVQKALRREVRKLNRELD